VPGFKGETGGGRGRNLGGGGEKTKDSPKKSGDKPGGGKKGITFKRGFLNKWRCINEGNREGSGFELNFSRGGVLKTS